MTLTWCVPIGEFALTSRPGRLTTMAASRCRAGRVQPHHAGRCRLRCAHASPGRWRRPSGEDGGPGVVWTASGNRSRSRSEAGGGTGRTRRRRRLRRSLIRGTIANRGSSTTRVPAAGSASGMRQEMHRNCTGTARTQRCQGSRPARWSGRKPQVRACSGRLWDKADAGQTAYGSEGSTI